MNLIVRRRIVAAIVITIAVAACIFLVLTKQASQTTVLVLSAQGEAVVIDPVEGTVVRKCQLPFEYPELNQIGKVYADPKRERFLVVRFFRPGGNEVRDSYLLEVFDTTTLGQIGEIKLDPPAQELATLAISPNRESYLVCWTDIEKDYVAEIAANEFSEIKPWADIPMDCSRRWWFSDSGDQLLFENWTKGKGNHLVVFDSASRKEKRRIYFLDIAKDPYIVDIKAGQVLIESTTDRVKAKEYELFTYELDTGRTSKRLKLDSSKYPSHMEPRLSVDGKFVIGDEYKISDMGEMTMLGRIHIFDIEQGKEIAFADVSDGGCGRDWTLSADGQYLYYLNDNLNVIDLRKGDVVKRIELEFAPDFLLALRD